MDITSFNLKQKVVQKRACEFISEWLRQNNSNCSEICFDPYHVSHESDYIKYRVRALNPSGVMVHLFELLCKGSHLEVSYLYDSNDPSLLNPGEDSFAFLNMTHTKNGLVHA